MQKNTTSIAAIIIALSIILSAWIGSGAADKFSSQNRYVTVKGLSEREVEADRVVWPILYKEVGNSLDEISRTSRNKQAIIKKYLIDNGIDESDILDSAPEIIDFRAETYVPDNITFRYSVTNVITVASKKVDIVRDLINRTGDLFAQGVVLSTGNSYQYNVIYEYTSLNDIKVDMIREASANARASAEQFAHDSESKLGKIKSATQGQISITDRDPNTPYLKKIRVITSISYFLND